MSNSDPRDIVPAESAGDRAHTDVAQPNPYLAASITTAPSEADAGVEELTTAECWRLLHTHFIGRLAVDGFDGRPNLYPVNFLAHNGLLYFRSAPGGKLRSIAASPAVAFEIDGMDARFHWSVVVRGDAHRLSSDAEIEESGIHHLISLSPTAKHNFVCITPVTVTGRRFSNGSWSAFPLRRAEGFELNDDAADSRSFETSAPGDAALQDDRPRPIPSFTPLPH